MSENEYAKLVARNLKRIAYDSGKSQVEISRDLGINQATLSSWMNGTRTPKMPNVDRLCAYFGCSRSDIIGTTAEYRKNDLKPLKKMDAKDIEILKAYHSSSKEAQAIILRILGIE